jgi:hypothetical protein
MISPALVLSMIVANYVKLTAPFRRIFWNIMMVEMKKTLNEKHHHEATHDPSNCLINAPELIQCVRQQVQDAHPKH